MPIDRPGKYCIDQDYPLRCTHAIGESCGGGSFIEIVADDVDLDLQGHTLSMKGHMLGIIGRGRNITVRNGFIKHGTIQIYSAEAPFVRINDDSPVPEPALPGDSFTRIEHIHIESGGIFVAGANALIRDNEVASEKDDLAPVCVYGQRAVIEKNVIGRMSGASQFHSYGIYLRNGACSVIRDNVLRNRGAQRNTFAIGLHNSQAVTVVDNAIHGFSTTVEPIGRNGALEMKNNRLEKTWSSWRPF